jgi:hypothetical protein
LHQTGLAGFAKNIVDLKVWSILTSLSSPTS